jgi:hypothetical protein
MALLERARHGYQIALADIAMHRKKPWYLRLFDSFVPSAEFEGKHVLDHELKLRFLERLIDRSQYELTIELDDTEANILFRRE